MTSRNNGFTLVELIVVITILAILGTIAFLSLQGQSAAARNSKRVTEVSNLSTAVALKNIQGVPYISMMEDGANAMYQLNYSGLAVPYIGSDIYNAGHINYTVLGLNPENYQDTWNPIAFQFVPVANADSALGNYRIGALKDRFFQIATIQEGDAGDIAYVIGNYAPRTSVDTTVTALFTGGDPLTVSIFSMSGADIGKLRAGDNVNVSGNNAEITSVSSDKQTITITGDTSICALTPGTSTCDVSLLNDESRGLIGDPSQCDTPVIHNETVLPYGTVRETSCGT